VTPIRRVLVLLAALTAAGCAKEALPAGTSAIPVRESLQEYPRYSVILDDMKAEGAAAPEYFHQYRVIYAEADSILREMTTPWMEVSGRTYRIHENNLGMAILAKDPEGTLDTIPAPPGYNYVGDTRYGEWRTDADGDSFWEFYGKYALLRGLLGATIYGADWDDFLEHRRRRRPYYGRDYQYGTYGTITRQRRPDFYERQARAEATRRARFNERAEQRSRRSNMSGFRGRSGGFGK
jgi:hypothetical protein